MVSLDLPAAYVYQHVKGLDFNACPEKPWVLVSCKIPTDCHVALTSVPAQYTPNEMYEIVIGGWNNSRSVIRKQKQGHEFSAVDTPNILDDRNFKSFWVSWKAGNIQVGKGDVVGEHIFMVFDDPNPSAIAAVSVSAWNAAGTVKISH